MGRLLWQLLAASPRASDRPGKPLKPPGTLAIWLARMRCEQARLNYCGGGAEQKLSAYIALGRRKPWSWVRAGRLCNRDFGNSDVPSSQAHGLSNLNVVKVASSQAHGLTKLNVVKVASWLSCWMNPSEATAAAQLMSLRQISYAWPGASRPDALRNTATRRLPKTQSQKPPVRPNAPRSFH